VKFAPVKFAPALRRGLTSLLQKAGMLSNVPVNGRGVGFSWFGDHLEFQRDIEVVHDKVLSHPTVYSCITLIASDVAKVGLELRMREDDDGYWEVTNNSAFSPVLRKPNHYQTRQQFIEVWMISKLQRGNAYVLKVRDARRVVVKLYVLDPTRVQPLVAPNGAVFYQLNSDDLSTLPVDLPAVPASEIIHDRMECLFHPLVGTSPIFACGVAATLGLKIDGAAAKFFQNMSRPSGVLTAPAAISDEVAARLKREWESNYTADNLGKVAVLGDSLKYESMAINATDAQQAEQLELSDRRICSAFHVPGFMVGVGDLPSFDNVQALWQQYYNQCLQKHFEAIEAVLDEGLGIAGTDLRTEFCLDDLLRMDSKTLAEVEGVKVQRGIASPNEARAKFNLPEAEGGDSPMVQQQNYSLAALAKRDSSADPFGKVAATPAPAPAPAPPEDGEDPASAEDVQRAVEAGIGKVIATVKADAETSLAEVSRLISASVAEVEQRMNARAEHERQVQEEAAARLQEFGDALTRRIARATSEA
jgi:HK97 family phage portal protein